MPAFFSMHRPDLGREHEVNGADRREDCARGLSVAERQVVRLGDGGQGAVRRVGAVLGGERRAQLRETHGAAGWWA